ncbi:hypothetical protein [Rhodocyclus purpureus]|jgi:hypothetical protein|nr:hypothetical protein [Rhodocyclus purpureus]
MSEIALFDAGWSAGPLSGKAVAGKQKAQPAKERTGLPRFSRIC